ncbi:MAG: DUF1566 domain-containing protein [Gammaproteobacteria bacterium]|nr:DUF1566 domain-containing protein [Gammaproteobacteria bacterium]
MRCILGAVSANDCTTNLLRYSWEAAFQAVRDLDDGSGFAGHKDWRLPTIGELSSIVERRCFAPAINQEVFPMTPVSGLWSATPDPIYPRGAMLVHFLNGGEYMGNKSQGWAVRLVCGER